MNTIKTTGEFVALVKMMRMCQRAYSENKNPVALRQAQKYEAEVDKAISEREERAAKQRQPSLPGCTS